MTRDLFEGRPNLLSRDTMLGAEARAIAGHASRETIPEELRTWAERERLIRKRKGLKPRSIAAIELRGQIRYLTDRLLKLENARIAKERGGVQRTCNRKETA